MKYKVLKNFYNADEKCWHMEGENLPEFDDPDQLVFLLNNHFIEIIPEKKGGRIWIPEFNEAYFFLTDMHYVSEENWRKDSVDNQRLANGNVFKTEEEAVCHLEKLKALVKIKKYIAENFEPWEPNWKDEDERKWSIHYSHDGNRFVRDWASTLQEYSTLPYFKTEQEAQEIIGKFEPELRVIFGVEEGKK